MLSGREKEEEEEEGEGWESLAEYWAAGLFGRVACYSHGISLFSALYGCMRYTLALGLELSIAMILIPFGSQQSLMSFDQDLVCLPDTR